MRYRPNGDASFLIGLVFGMFIGAAVMVALSPLYEDAREAITGQVHRLLGTETP